jgi:hypothetical protein
MSCFVWELACLSAFLETDNTKLPSSIALARSIIAGRLVESVPINEEEWLKIASALDALESLEEEKIPSRRVLAN